MNLFDCGMALVGQFCEGPPQILPCDFETKLAAIPDHDGKDCLRRHSLPRDPAAFVHRPQQLPGGDPGGGHLGVDGAATKLSVE